MEENQEMQLELALVKAQTTLKERELQLQREREQSSGGNAAVNSEQNSDFVNIKHKIPCMRIRR